MANTCCYRAKKKHKLEKLVGKSALKWYVSSENVHEYGYPDSGFSSYTLTDDGHMITRFHDQDGEVMFQTKTPSLRARGGEIDLASGNPFENIDKWQNEPLFLVGVVFLTCSFGFFSTLCIHAVVVVKRRQ